MLNDSINRYDNPNATRGFCWREIAWPPASCEAETIRESIKTKRKAKIVSIPVLSKVLSLDLFSCSQIWNIEKDRENEKVGDRLVKLNEKRSDRQLFTTLIMISKG